ncbi:MAG: hypothetical protein DHS20C16_04930 [Phycisphaerae bacterium]|nr:MAG: hypothetical protein DHS20C16_04930 [Phycisphaerae bacterium]
MADVETGGPPGTAQCEITGKWVPEDELIIIQGKRVCAEGKAELLDRLRGGEAMPGELECPTALRRFGCMFVDNLVMSLFGFVVGMVFGVGGFGLFGGATPTGINTFTAILQVVVGTIIPLAYYVGYHGKTGQTPGKKMGKIKVVRIDGSDINYNIAFWRILWYQGPGMVVGFISLLAIASTSNALLAVVGIFAILNGIYYLVNALAALLDKGKQRAIHDRLAGTRVIMVDA